jgi:hypothetical protein
VSALSSDNCDVIITGSSYCETLVVFMLIAQYLSTGVDIRRSLRLWKCPSERTVPTKLSSSRSSTKRHLDYFVNK